jgi:hypothetical protein
LFLCHEARRKTVLTDPVPFKPALLASRPQFQFGSGTVQEARVDERVYGEQSDARISLFTHRTSI